jgi:hypothetical protein
VSELSLPVPIGGTGSRAETPALRGSVADDVAELLADRVPAGVLDRVLVELLNADSDESDRDLRDLLGNGTVSGRLRTSHGSGAHLTGVRSDQQSRLVSRIRMHAEAYRIELAVCSLGKTVWLLVPQASRSALAQLLDQCPLPGLLAIGDNLTDLRLAPSRRASLEELLEVGQRRGWAGAVEIARLQAAMRVEALLDLAARQPELLEGPLDVLLYEPSHKPLAETLYRWLACGRDTVATAAATHMHVNSVRYRLRRAQEISGVDLDDWDQRLMAEVQLRMWKACAPA